MKFILQKSTGRDLKPGDLFVQAEPEELHRMLKEEIGVRVFIRTDVPLPWEDSVNHPVLKVIVDAKNTKKPL